jgi:hypothetical protein
MIHYKIIYIELFFETIWIEKLFIIFLTTYIEK